MPQDNVETVKAIYEAFGRADVPFLASVMDPEIEWNEAENFLYADGNPYIGLPAILEGVFGRFASDWDGFAAIPQEILGAGETVVGFGRYRGTLKKTGVAVNAQFVHVFRFENDKVIRFQQYTDTVQFRDAFTGGLAAKA